jgi:hypothetical protein
MFLYLIHLGIVLVFLSIPFWPVNLLQIGVFIPLVLSFMWFMCGGCPLSQMDDGLDGHAFTHDIYNRFFTINDKDSDRLTSLLVVGVCTLAFVNLIRKNN